LQQKPVTNLVKEVILDLFDLFRDLSLLLRNFVVLESVEHFIINERKLLKFRFVFVEHFLV